MDQIVVVCFLQGEADMPCYVLVDDDEEQSLKSVERTLRMVLEKGHRLDMKGCYFNHKLTRETANKLLEDPNPTLASKLLS